MGLPARWQDPEHGPCLSLYAALAHLKAQGAHCERDGDVLVIAYAEGPTRRVSPVQVKAIGMMYPLRWLEPDA